MGEPRKPIGIGIPALRGKQIAKVPEGTYGPYVGQAKDGALVVWAAEDPKAETRGWYATPVAPDGTPRAAARRLADAPPDVGLVVVRGSKDSGELALASTRRTALGEWVEVAIVRPPAAREPSAANTQCGRARSGGVVRSARPAVVWAHPSRRSRIYGA